MGNHNSGRRPKPTALKLLQGNPGKRKPNAREPKPTGPVIKPDLSPLASAEWDALAPVCLAMGTLTAADVKAFQTLCELLATLTMTRQEKSSDGFSPFLSTTMVDSAGNEHQNVKEHPAIGMERKTATTLRPYFEKFGLEPVARARIAVPVADEPASKWAGALS